MASLALLAGACGSSSSSSSTTTLAGGATTVKLPAATVNGSGSTFQKPFDDEAIVEFVALHSGVNITYAGGGSGAGLTALGGNLVQYAGTDAPVSATDALHGKESSLLYFPFLVAPITVSYKLSGVSKLTLSGPTLAQIFSGKITKWDDAAIKADNPSISSLPSTSITAIHRSDSSGTTHNFTLYLSKVDPTDWTFGTGKQFSAPGGAGANANGGVATQISKTEGGIGYVDFSDAKAAGLTFASIKNANGDAIAPTLAAASAAAAAAPANADLTFDPTNVSAAGAYPITAPTWILIYKTQATKAQGDVLKAFLDFILSTGLTKVAPMTNFAPIQGDLLTKAKAQLDQIVIPAS
ncbi:MAG: phosphate ABC transporter substrate-binding protein PstS [Actinomycetota bacterium]|nr:phosphate ABC transporter substrate-binding protein PstS [Actinomycetota bacterium]